MSIEVVQDLPEDKWRRFMETHPAGNIYHTPEMFRVFARVKGYRPTLWAAVNSDQRPLALLLPVEITLMNGLMRPFTTRAVAYGSVLADRSPEGREALRRLLKTYQRRVQGDVLFTELRNLTDLSEIQPLLGECGLVYEKHLNYLVDLTLSDDDLWRKVTKSGQQSVRTSRNKGTVIVEATSRAELMEIYQLLQMVYQRAQVPLADIGLFEAAFEVLGPQGMFKAFVARAGERSIGACLVLAYKDRVIDWYAGTDREFSAYGPMEALIWHVIGWGKAQGLRVFDFGGAGRPEEDYGPRKFKAKFGGELVEFGRDVCVHSKLRLQLSQFGYGLLRRFL